MLCIREEILPYAEEKIWAVLTDLHHTDWRSDLDRVEVVDDTHFVEYARNGIATTFTVTASDPPRRWAFSLENARLTGRWMGFLEPAPGGTRVIFAESVFPARYWMRPLVYGWLKRQQKRYFADLKRKLAQE